MRARTIRRPSLAVLGLIVPVAVGGLLVRCASSNQQASQSLVDTQSANATVNESNGAQDGEQPQEMTNNSSGINANSSDVSSNEVGNFSPSNSTNSADEGVGVAINNAPLDNPALTSPGGNNGSTALSNSPSPNLPLNLSSGAATENSAQNSLKSGAGVPTNGQPSVPSNGVAQNPNQISNQTNNSNLGSPHGVLNWVGYDYKRDAKRLDVQIVTDGAPTYRIFKERNRAGQSEIVVRYQNTKLRSKIRRDVDASEFRSPVAYIRMRYDATFNHTDVVMTLRDEIEPTLVNKGSSLMFSFVIPERWFAPKSAEVPVAAAELIEDAPAGMPTANENTNEGPSGSAAFVDNPGADKFHGVDPNGGVKLVPKVAGDKELVPENSAQPVEQSIPASGKPGGSGEDLLENNQPSLDFIEFVYSLNAVAQENFSAETPSTNGTSDLLEDVPVDLTAANAAAESKPAPADAGVQPNQLPAPSGAQPAGTEVLGVDSGASATSISSKKVMRLDFREAPVSQVIKMIAAESNINFIISPDAGNKTTSISLKNVPWDVALKAVLDSNRLGMQEMSPGLVRIDFLDNFAKDHEAAEKARQATEALIPTKVLVMPLNYLKSDAAAGLAREMLPKADSSNITQSRSVARFRVQSEPRTNSIVVEATPSVLNTIKTLLEKLDTQTPQVRIQSRLVEFTKNFDDGLGVTWNAPLNIDGGRGLGFGSLPFPNSLNSNFAVDPGGAKVAGGTAAFKLGSINNFLALDFKIRAYESKKMAETLQTQDVVVQDNEQASIVAGSDDYINGTAGVGGAATPTKVSYNLSLNVTPHITADGTVQMKLEIHGDSPKDALGSALLSSNTRALSTTLLKRSGETAVIGGLYSSEVKETTLGVPLLSRIPLIGALFRSRDKSDSKKDLLIMVTPTILGSGSASAGGATGASLVPSMENGAFSAPPENGQSQAAGQSANAQQSQSAQSQNGSGQSAQSSNASLQMSNGE